MKPITTLDKIYEEAKAKRLVLTLDEFAKKIGTSRASLYRFKENKELIPTELVTNAMNLLNETKNVQFDSKEDLIQEGAENILALKAAVRVLTLLVTQHESKIEKISYSDAALSVEKKMKLVQRELLDELKQ